MLFVSVVYLGGLRCFVLYSAVCTAQSKTAKVIADMEQEGAAQSPSGAPIAVEMSQVEGVIKSTIDPLTSKLTNKIDEKLQSFKRQIVEEQSSRLDSAVKRFKKDGYFFKKEDLRDKLKGRSKPCWLNVPNRRTRDFSRCQSEGSSKFGTH